MEHITNYIQQELLVLIAVLYIIGIGLKKTNLLSDKLIPVILGLSGVVLSAIYVLAANHIGDWQQAMTAIFTAITQGILIAGTSVYFNQIYKQVKKSGDSDETMQITQENEIDEDAIVAEIIDNVMNSDAVEQAKQPTHNTDNENGGG